MLFLVMMFGVMAAILVVAGMWMLLTRKEVTTSSDMSRILMAGFIGAALLRIFFKPATHRWGGWEKKVLSIFFLVAGLSVRLRNVACSQKPSALTTNGSSHCNTKNVPGHLLWHNLYL
jgi:uncharacterized membrane protein